MKNIISYIRNRHDLFFKVFYTLLCIAAIVFILPKEVQFKYEFQKGKPWLHENLIAPFDFPIYKSAATLEEEKQEIKNKTHPCFRISSEVSDKKISEYREKFELKWQNLTEKIEQNQQSASADLKNLHFTTGERILKSVYDKGIIKIDDVIEGKPGEFVITILNNNIAEDRELQEFLTIQSAYDFVGAELKKDPEIVNEFLQPLLEDLLDHNLVYDAATTDKIIENKLGSYSLTRGIVLKNEKIIDRGDVVTDDLHRKLASLKKEYENEMGAKSNSMMLIAGQIILISVLMLLLIFFLSLFRRNVINENNKVSFIFILLTLIVYLTASAVEFEKVNIYVLPFCILPVIIRTFYDIRLATFIHIIAIFIAGFMAPNSFEFVLIQFVAGVVAIFWLASLRRRSQLFSTSLVIFIAYSITYFGISILREGEWQNIDFRYFAWFGISALLTLFAYPMMFIFEKAFGFLSDVSLIEISDTNNTVLRDLASKAPGTFQHSLQVANLAEEAVHHVGGNPLLVRTGALYHDIGKLRNPMYFIENQVRGINPHDELSHVKSAKIITGHVIEGIEMAKKNKLPQQIIDFIRTHHGTTLTGYFYNSYKKENPDKEINEEDFRYPGPIPYSKETAILMMADSVEAAARSLKQHDPETINNLVDNIIDSQAKQGQFINAPITFKDLTEIKKIFKKMLMNIYHVRIEYPKAV